MIYQVPSEKGILWATETNKRDGRHRLLRVDLVNGRTETFEHQPHNKHSLVNDVVNIAFEDKSNRLWFGTGSGISLYDEKTKQFTNYTPADLTENQITNILADKHGLLWMTSSFGLLCFNPESLVFKRYVHDKNDPTSLADNNINDLYFDRDGTLWITVSWGGVDRVNPIKSAFTPLLAQRKTFPWHDIHYVVQAPDGQLWVAAQNGLFRYNKLTQTIVLVERAAVKRVCVAKNGLIYYHPIDAVNNGDGPAIFDPVTGNTSRYRNIRNDTTSLSNNNIQCMLEDHTGIIWLGTFGNGICAFNPYQKKFIRYPYIINDNTKTSLNMLDHNLVTSMYEDSRATLWVGTDAGGLNHYDRKRNIFISSFRPKDGLSTVTSISQDNRGRLWAGTYLNGLFLVDNNTGLPLKRFTIKDGLLMDQVLLIHSNNDNFLWVASERGFSRLNTSNYAIKNIKAEGNYWEKIFYNVSTGYDKINTISVIDKNLVLIGGDDMISFNSGNITKDTIAPIVHIETMTSSDPQATKHNATTVETYKEAQKKLPWNENQVTFNYVALHYTDPAGIRYAYRLDGYDNQWTQVGARRSATYTNLSPGTYTFLVKAANSDGVWSDKSSSFTLIIKSPWWQTWWAWVFWVILFILGLYAFITYRSRKLLQDKKVLEHKVQARTEEVIRQKEEIEAQRDNIEHAYSELKTTQSQLVQREKMASLGELTAGIAHEIQNPLNFVNNFSEVSVELLDELKDEARAGHGDDVIAIADDLTQNLEKIRHHGKRADFIVKGMLEHSRTSTGERQETDINVLADEFLKLSYHGLRAKDKSFNADLVTRFDDKLPMVNIVRQDIGRVMLNLFNNAFYAVNQKAKTAGPDYKPMVAVTAAQQNNSIIISVKDNGTGIPESIREKIMQPFFTTKPTGDGTGLGLSLSYDIVVKGHGGNIDVDTKEGEFTVFTVTLPLN